MRIPLAGWCVLLAVAGAFAADKPKDGTFTVTKPVGTWVREVKIEETKHVFTLTVTDDRLTLRVETEHGVARLDGDYAINKESVLFGVIDTCDHAGRRGSDAAALSHLSGQPFAVRFRVDGDELTLKEFKGLGVGKGEKWEKAFAEEMAAVCGRYKALKLSSDPLLRQDELLNQSEGAVKPTLLRTLYDGLGRLLFASPHVTPQRIHGGIL